MKNSNDIIGNRTRDIPFCSAVPQPTASPLASSTQVLFQYARVEAVGNRYIPMPFLNAQSKSHHFLF